MPRVGIVDLGSNTVRLVVYDYERDTWFRLVDEIRERVRLGTGLGSGGALQELPMARALDLLGRFQDYARASRLDSLAIYGTSAVRDASNAGEFLRRATELGLTITVLSGEEEARYGSLAVANGLDLDNAWVVDMGGGSAQISQLCKRSFSGGQAYPLGAVRLTETYLGEDLPKPRAVAKLEAALAAALGPVVEEIEASSAPIVAMGGTIRNLARAVQKAEGYPLALLHGYKLRRSSLETLTERLLKSTPAERGAISGINSDRGDVILAGALLFRWLLRTSGRKRLLISGHGVREGALYQRVLAPPHLLDNVRKFSVDLLVHKHAGEDEHASQVRRLARRLFSGLSPLHGLGRRSAELLDAAAALHETGLAVQYYRRGKHGAYLLGAAPLDGFRHREQALIMLLVRYHRKGVPKLGSYAEPLMRSNDDHQRLVQLVVCLRLANALDRARMGRVQEVEIKIKRKSVRLQVRAQEEPKIELWDAMTHAGFFQEVFGLRLKITSAGKSEALQKLWRNQPG